MPKFVHMLLGHPAVWVLLALLMAGVGALVVRWWERRRPSSFRRRRGGDLAWWGLLPADEEAAVDLSAADQAEEDAFQDWKAQAAAAEAERIRRASERAAVLRALFRP
ncbi:hypothetical protein ACWC4D_33830 [Streptomyces sp. NPDC001288]